MKIQKRVKDILDKYPKTRSDDHLYIIRYYQEYYCSNEMERNVIERILTEAPTGASLIRQRAYLQNTLGEYLPGEGVIRNRRKKEQRIREEYSSINNLLQGFFRWFK